ncbi:PREDICTED: uncharacterized protein LOC104610191 [Nelumbo nucifera]|uniref:Uncharacterized protein LOC104610191 n=1 Tax=Nelumbo nucifera TaxID=4432 RepID=A0A1U8BE86_NELNU|nr:PREDICTED: uncharacterized protein LOC104610191 [Nelumbo nucifera]
MEHDLLEYQGCHPTLLDRLQAEADEVKALMGENSWGNVIRLSRVTLNWPLLKAAFQCWDCEKLVFCFGDNHMCPTLEEIAYMLQMQLEDEILFPVAKQGYRTELANYLRCKRTHLEMINENAVSIEFLVKRSATTLQHDNPTKETEGKNHALVLAIVGHLLFPQDRDSINLRLITPLRQLEELKQNPRNLTRVALVPMVLAEILRSLTAVKASGTWPFQGSLQLLQLWLIQHLPFLVITNIDSTPLSPGPTDKIVEVLTHSQPAYLTPEDYHRRLQMVREEEIQWKIGISIQNGCTQPRLAAEGRQSMVLAGLYGSIQYIPLLVLRQFGYKQIVPTYDAISGEAINFEKHCGTVERRFKGLWASSKRELAISPATPLCSCEPFYYQWLQNSGISPPSVPPPGIPTPVKPPSPPVIRIPTPVKPPSEDPARIKPPSEGTISKESLKPVKPPSEGTISKESLKPIKPPSEGTISKESLKPVKPPSEDTKSKESLKRPLEEPFLQAILGLHKQIKKIKKQETPSAREKCLQEELVRAQTDLEEVEMALKQAKEKLDRVLREKNEANLRAQQLQKEAVGVFKRMQVHATRDVIATAWMSRRIAKLEDALRQHGIEIPPPLPCPLEL